MHYLTSPVFPEVKLRLGQGRVFRIVAHHAGPENIYAQSVKLNGKPYANFFITHEDIMRGGVLEFEMGPAPAPQQVVSQETK